MVNVEAQPLGLIEAEPLNRCSQAKPGKQGALGFSVIDRVLSGVESRSLSQRI
jgi:hypothetical protein